MHKMRGRIEAVVTCIHLWVAFGLGIASLSVDAHIFYGAGLREGLFNGKNVTGETFVVGKSN